MEDTAPNRPRKAEALACALGQLGEPTAVFKPSPIRMGMGVLVGLAICVFGLTFAGHFGLGFRDTTRAANPHLERWGTAVFGLLLSSGGVWLLLYTWGMINCRVMVCPGGLIRVRRRAIDTFPWDTIQYVRQTIHRHKIMKGPKVLVPKTRSDIFLVVRRDNVSFAFDRDDFRHAGQLGELIHEEARRREISWEVDEVYS